MRSHAQPGCKPHSHSAHPANGDPLALNTRPHAQPGCKPRSHSAHPVSLAAFDTLNCDQLALITRHHAAWLADSGTTSHLCINRDAFLTYTTVSNKTIIGISPDSSIPVHGIGTVAITFMVDGQPYPATLTNVNHAPDAPYNLVSLSRLT
ncbi:hypothetical protein AURDEDRAFT_77593, partial [Auricularia subglabra TFB-10046 SS5]